MSYRILPTKQFAKDFRNLKDRKIQDAIKRKIEEVSKNPTRYKRLHYALSGSYRIRIGPYRILYSVNENKREMYLEKMVFGHRYR